MQEKAKYRFDVLTKILFKEYFGDISLQDIEDSWEKAKLNGEIPADTSGFILDYDNALLYIKAHELEGIAAYYRKNLDIFGGKRIAIITTNPKNIVVPVLVEALDQGYESKPFSTYEAAIDWVLKVNND